MRLPLKTCFIIQCEKNTLADLALEASLSKSISRRKRVDFPFVCLLLFRHDSSRAVFTSVPLAFTQKIFERTERSPLMKKP